MQYMEVALELARRGETAVEPNPMVGALIVKNGLVIGQGCHEKFGGPHAEINAIVDCRSKGHDPAGATIYVTLEPCCHHGKTPPCTDAIIQAGVAKVVIAMIDPSPHAAGQGVTQLRQTGVEVELGLCEKQARLLNAPFIKHTRTGKCWVIAKWAQSADGKLAWADRNAENRWMTNEKSRQDVHRLRRRVGAILVGINTVIADDPLLTARPPGDRRLLRIVLDSNLRIPLKSQLLNTAEQSPVIIFAGADMIDTNPDIAESIQNKGAEIIPCPMQTGVNLKFVLDQLSRRNVQQVLVEGGAEVITSLLEDELADEAAIYIAPTTLAEKGDVPISEPMAELANGNALENAQKTNFDNDTWLTGLTATGLKQIQYQ